MTLRLLLVALIAVTFGSRFAQAGLLSYINDPGQYQSQLQQLRITEGLVLFNQSQMNQLGNPVYGRVNGANGQVGISAHNQTVTLLGTGGQAPQVSDASGQKLLGVLVFPSPQNDPLEGLFQAVSFHLDVDPGVLVTIAADLPGTMQTFEAKPGQDIVGLIATGSDRISSVEITSNDGFDAIRNIQVGFAGPSIPTPPPIQVVPEPRSTLVWAACGLMILLGGFWWRHRVSPYCGSR